MSDSLEDFKKAQEDAYFEKANQEALKRLTTRGEAAKKLRASPVTGKAMEQMTYMGINIDRCQDSGGVWLDKGELEEIIKRSQEDQTPFTPFNFLKKIFG